MEPFERFIKYLPIECKIYLADPEIFYCLKNTHFITDYFDMLVDYYYRLGSMKRNGKKMYDTTMFLKLFNMFIANNKPKIYYNESLFYSVYYFMAIHTDAPYFFKKQIKIINDGNEKEYAYIFNNRKMPQNIQIYNEWTENDKKYVINELIKIYFRYSEMSDIGFIFEQLDILNPIIIKNIGRCNISDFKEYFEKTMKEKEIEFNIKKYYNIIIERACKYNNYQLIEYLMKEFPIYNEISMKIFIIQKILMLKNFDFAINILNREDYKNYANKTLELLNLEDILKIMVYSNNEKTIQFINPYFLNKKKTTSLLKKYMNKSLKKTHHAYRAFRKIIRYLKIKNLIKNADKHILFNGYRNAIFAVFGNKLSLYSDIYESPYLLILMNMYLKMYKLTDKYTTISMGIEIGGNESLLTIPSLETTYSAMQWM